MVELLATDLNSNPDLTVAEQFLMDTDFSQIAGFTPTSRQLEPNVQIDPACENEVKASVQELTLVVDEYNQKA